MSLGADQPTIRKRDLDAAVAAGVIEAAAAERLLAFARQAQALPSQADEEGLRLITGFNDIFVTIGIGLFLAALHWVGDEIAGSFSGPILVAAGWLLAEVFTRMKRMALPSIVLLLAYSGAVFLSALDLLSEQGGQGPFEAVTRASGTAATAALVTAGFIALHWLHFRVPVTIAAGCAALALLVVATVASMVPGLLDTYPVAVFLPLGLAIFALAMRFDMSDRARLTRRTDIAFWLHLLAAPLIVHPVVMAVTSSGDMTSSDAGLVIALFVLLGLVALVTDRRALLVSSLSYLGYAAHTLITGAGWSSMSFALAVLAVGAIVLLMSVAWRPLRAAVIAAVPEAVRQRVPAAA